MMNLQRIAILAVSLLCAASAAMAQAPDNSPAGKKPQISSTTQNPASDSPRGTSEKDSSRADAYYN